MGRIIGSSGRRADIKLFPDPERLSESMAVHTASILEGAIDKQGRASIAVSGGTTPAPYFNALSKQDLPWQRITITLVDERWVPPTHPDSNEALVRRHLLKDKASNAEFIGLYSSAPSALEAENECERRLSRVMPLDLVVLGMGSDGHTASLFPGSDRLQEAISPTGDRLCTAITPKDAPHERMTLTLPAILSSARIFLLITGQKKMDVLKKALEEGPPEQMPIRYVLDEADPPVTVYFAP